MARTDKQAPAAPAPPLARGGFVIVSSKYLRHQTFEEALSIAQRMEVEHPNESVIVAQVVASVDRTIISKVTRHRF